MKKLHKKKKILFLAQLPPPNHGVTKINHLLFKSEIINKKFDCTAIPLNYSEKISDIGKFNIKKLLILVKTALHLFYSLAFKRINIVYFTITPAGNGFFRDLLYIAIMRLFKARIILHIHGIGISQEITKNKFSKKLYYFAFKNAEIIHLSKKLLEDEILNHFSLLESNLWVVNNGIEDSIKKYDKKNENINILYVSNLRESKGVMDLITIYSKLAEKYKEIILNVAGEFDEKHFEKKIKDIVHEKGLTNSVIFHGTVEGQNKERLYQKCDLFLYPTHNDAMPLVLIECMKYGLPFIAYNVGAIKELAEDCKNGIVVTKFDHQGFCNEAIRLLDNNHQRQALSKNGRNTFKTKYTKERMENEVLKILEVQS